MCHRLLFCFLRWRVCLQGALTRDARSSASPLGVPTRHKSGRFSHDGDSTFFTGMSLPVGSAGPVGDVAKCGSELLVICCWVFVLCSKMCGFGFLHRFRFRVRVWLWVWCRVWVWFWLGCASVVDEVLDSGHAKPGQAGLGLNLNLGLDLNLDLACLSCLTLSFWFVTWPLPMRCVAKCAQRRALALVSGCFGVLWAHAQSKLHCKEVDV